MSITRLKHSYLGDKIYNQTMLDELYCVFHSDCAVQCCIVCFTQTVLYDVDLHTLPTSDALDMSMSLSLAHPSCVGCSFNVTPPKLLNGAIQVNLYLPKVLWMVLWMVLCAYPFCSGCTQALLDLVLL